MISRGLVRFTCFLALVAGPARAQLSSLETEHLRLVYEPATTSYLIPHAARCFENAIAFHRRLFDWEPSEKVTVILNDFSDFGHGAAVANPRNTILVSIAPMSLAFETYPSNERMNTLMNHELVHIAALDRAAGRDRFFRTVFRGKVQSEPEHPETILYEFLTCPRRSAPRWYHEGLAVFLETWMAGGLGRAQGAYDELVFRAMVRDGSAFYDPLGLESEGTRAGFQGGATSYLYGTRFVSYLADRYSPEAVVDWASRTAGSRTYYAAQFERTFGQPLDRAWEDWTEWERGFQAANLDSIRQYRLTPFRDVSANALGSVSRAWIDGETETLYAAVNYPGTIAHVAAISLRDGSLRKLHDVKGPLVHTVASLAWDPDARALFYTTDNGAWRDLCRLDPATGRAEVLAKDLRVGDLVVNRADHSVWGIRHLNGITTVIRIPPPYRSWEQVISWPYGTTMYDIDLSSDGRRLCGSVAEIDGSQTLRVFDTDRLLAGDTTAVASRGFGSSVPSNFVFSPDDRYLYGSSYYTGASNIFRYEVANDSLDCVTNCETGFFRPVPLGGDSLLVFRYTGEGFVPAEIRAVPLEDVSAILFLGADIAERHPVVRGWNVGSPLSIGIDSLTTYAGEYRALRQVGLASAVPVVEGYKESVAYGLALDFSDPVFIHRLDASASYSPDGDLPEDERTHVRIRYRRYDWTAAFALNGADFYDLFGPTKTSRKGQSLGLHYQRNLVLDDPRTLDFRAGVTGYRALERLPDYQNVTSSFEELLSGSAGLHYRNLDFSLGAVDYEKGLMWELVTFANAANGETFPGARGGLDVGTPLPLGHSSLWLRTAAGASPGDRAEPFANFFFGGFGNNWVDHQEIRRYREHYAFPGVELNEIGGRNFGKALLEWNLPPLRFRRAGTSALYATWIRASIFSGVVVTNLDHDPSRRILNDVGGQADLRLTLLSNLNLTLSTGWAVSFEDHRRKDDELMISLKIL